MIVIGGGVVGLSTAITLLDAGLAVEIWAKDEAPPASTAATAVWHLFLVEDSRRTNEWAQFSKATLESFIHLPLSGILSRDGIELIRSSTPVVPQLLKPTQASASLSVLNWLLGRKPNMATGSRLLSPT